MNCPGCDRENRADARFCDGCGAVLEIACARCDRELRAGARFCDGCGAEVGGAPEAAVTATTAPESERTPRSYTPRHLAERILTQKSALIGERKLVSVLFADVEGFTPLAEIADPETMHALLDRSFQIALDEVHHYEGTINQFTGDGFMALFGAPIALEDAPRRAVLAALAIQRKLEPLNAEISDRFGLPFRMRMGIHSGPVVVGSIGDDLRMDYTAVGDTTNLAARLQQAADPGRIWLSEATHGRISGYFELRDLGDLAIKGKSRAVRAFEVLGERDVSGEIEAGVDSGLTPMTGREHEISTLQTAFGAVREQRGQVAMLVGEAGIGKSRVVYEFRQSLADEPHIWLEGRCSPFGTTTAFQALADALRRSFDIDDRDDEAGALAKLEKATERFGSDLEWTQPYMRQLLALPVGDSAILEMDAMDRRSETYRALQSWLLRIAERRPLVLVFEDLHWIDAASEEFLAYLAKTIPATRILLLVTFRRGYQHPFGDRSYHVLLALQALSGRDMAAMASALLGPADSLPVELIDLLTRKAEGNPLFVEEVTRSLLEEGVICIEDGQPVLQRSLAEISVPDRIQDVLMARLDRLPEEPKRAIQVASVIGREFALRLLSQIREAGDRVQDVIGELRDLELIYEKAAHPELAFMFKHALTHDVAYDSILLARRKALHRIVGCAIEELYGDRLAEHFEALAHHFERAEEWERALHYHKAAADKAAAAYANRSVVEHCNRALAILEQIGDDEHPGLRHTLHSRLGGIHFELSEFTRSAESHLLAAEAGEARAMSLAKAALSLVWAHEYEHCADIALQVTESTEQTPDPGADAIAMCATDLLSVACDGIGDRSDIGAEALRIADSSDSVEAVAMAYSQRALFLEQQGSYREAIELSERVLDRAHNARLSLMTVYPRWSLGKALCCVGEYGRALEVFRKALEDTDRCGDRALKARLLNTLGWVHAEIHDYDRAREYNERGELLAAEMVKLGLVAGAPELYANAASNLANNFTAMGMPERAIDLLEPFKEELGQPGDPWQRWRWAPHIHDGLARAALSREDPESTIEWTDRELEIARTHNARKVEARALELRGRALTSMDLRDDAEHVIRSSLEIAEAIEYQPVIWRADALLLELARRRGDAAEAERRGLNVRRRLESAASRLQEDDLRLRLRALSEALIDDPLGAYR
jgi:predicted ATPase/class 3 adenylate cyclase